MGFPIVSKRSGREIFSHPPEGLAGRTKLPKCALLEALAQESMRTRRFPGIGYRGLEHSRRSWVIGTGLDVWKIVELYEGKGRERLLSEHNVSERQLDLALSYHEAYPREIDEALE